MEDGGEILGIGVSEDRGHFDVRLGDKGGVALARSKRPAGSGELCLKNCRGLGVGSSSSFHTSG